MGATASATNKVVNETITRSTLESINSSVNEYVSNVVTKSAASCAASSAQFTENTIGKIIMTGDNLEGKIDITNEQDSQVNLQCMQQSIQQTNIGNEIATSIMQQMTQSVDQSALSKLITTSEAKNEQGFGANPFASSNAEVNVNTENKQLTETNRKLSNLISNKVANNIKATDIKDCFTKTTQTKLNQYGNVKMIGESNKFSIVISTKQVAESLAVCQQLTQQTSSITNDIATALGLIIVDDKKIAVKTDSTAKASASIKTVGIEGIFDAFTGAFGNLFGIFMSASSMMFIMIIILAVVMKKKGGAKTGDAKNPGASTKGASNKGALDDD
jgi:hypothetical protein